VRPVRITGDLVAYGFSCDCREHHRWGAAVNVVGMNPRRQVVKYSNLLWWKPTDLVLRHDGAVAAIARRYGDTMFDVWKQDAAGESFVDTGSEIDPASLELTGDTISWVNDGMRREHTLTPPPE
jgi:hypothetical protein